MPISTLLVANRGEIACRVMRACAELGIGTVAVFSTDDANGTHVCLADSAVSINQRGPAAYLDGAAIIAAALSNGCDAIHPGYGFLSENAEFAAACADAGLIFVGPSPDALDLFGDKSAAIELAANAGVGVLESSGVVGSADEAAAVCAALGDEVPIMLKAVAGGGGRGMRVVRPGDDLAGAFDRCASEALSAFGSGALYVEQLLENARHIEVQLVGDATGAVSHLWDRDCSLQRQQQKIVEYAPAPNLSDAARTAITEAAVRIGIAGGATSLVTVEFLVDAETEDFYFIEANPRLQVEHTVTEEVTGIDLVQAQLQIAGGATLADIGLTTPPTLRGAAVQLRINTETMQRDGTGKPTGGTLTHFQPPSGLGVRTETHGYAGYTTSPSFDSLLAKLVVFTPGGSHSALLAKARVAVDGFDIGGVATNASFLRALLDRDEVVAHRVTTTTVQGLSEELVAEVERIATNRLDPSGEKATASGLVGATVDSRDPLAVLAHGKSSAVAAETPSTMPVEGDVAAPLQGTIVSQLVDEGAEVAAGTNIAVMEAMKMEHLIAAPHAGIVGAWLVTAGDAVFEGHVLVNVAAADVSVVSAAAEDEVDLDHIRPDLAEVIERHEIGLDERRPASVARRRKTGHRTTRENIADLVDEGTFVEWGPLVVAAQRKRRQIDDLIANTPADGLVGGIGSINGDQFGDDGQTVVVSYDYTVLAGTQGFQNHRKKDRMFELAATLKLPVVLFAEGGGGRPGDTDGVAVAGLDCLAFQLFGELSGLVPLVGITTGRCFAGNAALLGSCDVVIATEGSNIGMGGPAMIEGGGLGIFTPDEVGPLQSQIDNGVVDIAVKDEEEAVAVAKKYLAFFQGPTPDWSVEDQRKLRHLIPENRLRIYDVRAVIDNLFDHDSVLELRAGFAPGLITSLARVEGRPVGVVANNPSFNAGAIDSREADKSARFMQLCDAFDIPIVFLCDTPGFMVGPAAEASALVRHAARLFVVGASLSIPICTIVLRKGYGLGAQAMAGGSFKAPIFTVGWPTSEFGGMGLEGAVKLGYRKELEAIDDPDERIALFDTMVAKMYEVGKGVSMSDHFEIDDVIDPADTRRWIMAALKSAPKPPHREGKKRPCIDTW